MLIPPGESVVDTRSCRACGIEFSITDADMRFYEKISPTFAGKKELIPPPTLCPDCRHRRRLAFRNERKLYKRKCDLSGKDIISIYHPDSPHTVYEQSLWWWDSWSAHDYGREFDFSQTFSEQFGGLLKSVPRMSRIAVMSENVEYAHDVDSMKNVYMSFNSFNAENVYYSSAIWLGGDTVFDSYLAIQTNICYECVNILGCFACFFCLDCRDLRNCFFCRDCQNCEFCFGCVNLIGKKYMIFNEQYTPENYEAFLKKVRDGKKSTLDKIKNQFQQHTLKHPRRYAQITKTENGIGDSIDSSKDCIACFDGFFSENTRYSLIFVGLVDSMDCTNNGWDQSTRCPANYEAIGNYFSERIAFLNWCNKTHDSQWCDTCYYSHHLFGCVGLRSAEYAILNTPYSTHEYDTLVPKIIAHMRETWEWGEFFSPSLSPFGYNETVAMEYFPLSKEEAIAAWFNWSDYEPPLPQVEKIIPAHKLPDTIDAIPDDILNWAIECEITKKPYKIIKQELDFYRKHKLPIPRRHPDQRHLDRLKQRNPRKLYERHCDNPHCEHIARQKHQPLDDTNSILHESTNSRRRIIITPYAPDRPERVYCGVCYDQEVYG